MKSATRYGPGGVKETVFAIEVSPELRQRIRDALRALDWTKEEPRSLIFRMLRESGIGKEAMVTMLQLHEELRSDIPPDNSGPRICKRCGRPALGHMH